MMEKRFPRSSECESFEAELAPYLEGEPRPSVAAHAQQCVFCAAALSDLELIRGMARALPLEDAPPAVWANIRATLEAEGILGEPRRPWAWLQHLGRLHHLAPVGALACLIVVGVVLTTPPSRLLTTRRSFTVPAAEQVAGKPAPTVTEGDVAWARTIDELEKNYKAREAFLEPGLKATYRKCLESLNGSIHECLVSLDAEPTNTLARDYLLAAYSQKADLLTSALEFSDR